MAVHQRQSRRNTLRQRNGQELKVGENYLSQERIDRLTAIGVQWRIRKSDWNGYYNLLLDFQAMHQHLNIPKSYRTPDGLRVGEWAKCQRKYYRNTLRKERGEVLKCNDPCLNPERIKLLNDIAFPWEVDRKHRRSPPEQKEHAVVLDRKRRRSPAPEQKEHAVERDQAATGSSRSSSEPTKRDLDWHNYYRLLPAFKAEYKHLKVPRTYVTPDGVAIGQWAMMQRLSFQRKLRGLSFHISQHHVDLLNALQFPFQLLESDSL
jgi:Helicase associated domain